MKASTLSARKLFSSEMGKPSQTENADSSLREHITRLKDDFDKKYQENEVSQSSEKLKEYKFLAILGQGAFGLVVIYHSSCSLTPLVPMRFSSL